MIFKFLLTNHLFNISSQKKPTTFKDHLKMGIFPMLPILFINTRPETVKENASITKYCISDVYN
jgi:hypothetical protein